MNALPRWFLLAIAVTCAFSPLRGEEVVVDELHVEHEELLERAFRRLERGGPSVGDDLLGMLDGVERFPERILPILLRPDLSSVGEEHVAAATWLSVAAALAYSGGERHRFRDFDGYVSRLLMEIESDGYEARPAYVILSSSIPLGLEHVEAIEATPRPTTPQASFRRSQLLRKAFESASEDDADFMRSWTLEGSHEVRAEAFGALARIGELDYDDEVVEALESGRHDDLDRVVAAAGESASPEEVEFLLQRLFRSGIRLRRTYDGLARGLCRRSDSPRIRDLAGPYVADERAAAWCCAAVVAVTTMRRREDPAVVRSEILEFAQQVSHPWVRSQCAISLSCTFERGEVDAYLDACARLGKGTEIEEGVEVGIRNLQPPGT